MVGRVEKIFIALMVAIDLVVAAGSVLAAYYLRFHRPGLLPQPTVHHPWQAYLGLAIMQMLLLPLVFLFQQHYRLRRSVSRIDEFYRIFTGTSVATMLSTATTALISPDFEYSRALIATAWLLTIIFVWLARMGQYWLHGFLRCRGVGEARTLIVGTGEVGRVILNKMRGSPSLGYRAVGFLSTNGSQDTHVDGVPVLGRVEDVGDIVRERGIREVIIAEPSLSHRNILDIVARCEKYRVNIKVFPDVFQIMASEISIGDLNGLPMLSVRDVALRGWKLGLKRVVDVVLSVTVLIALSPLMLLTALLIKLTSPDGPVFYVQERVGLDGKPFLMLKFRSMRPDAEALTGPVWARPGDPRTTRLGAFLRRFSLDELPQFINVLLGDMSVVGPRPERPHFVEQFSQRVPRYLERHKEKAGLTGWAQVNGLRGNVSIEERTAYDLWYVENWTLWLDFKIILRTIFTIFRDKNAY